MSGRVWEGPDCGPGRDLRAPPPRRVLDPCDYPSSAQLDRALAGADEPPDVIYRAQPADLPVGQLYDRPQRPVGSRREPQDPRVYQQCTELATEQHPPPHRKSGFRVHRDHGGGAQALPVRRDRTVADYLGAQHFAPDGPDAAPGPFCAYCFQAMQPGPAGSGKKYCTADCRKRAWLQKQAANYSA